MLELKKPRPKITPLRIGITIIILIVLWIGLQIASTMIMDTVFFRFLLLCILGFGFLIITFLLKYG